MYMYSKNHKPGFSRYAIHFHYSTLKLAYQQIAVPPDTVIPVIFQTLPSLLQSYLTYTRPEYVSREKNRIDGQLIKHKGEHE